MRLSSALKPHANSP
jgi:hypothetical protein